MLAIDILKWPGVSVPFLTSFVISLVLIFAVIPYGKRRPVGKPVTWGEAMIGSTYAFGVMLLAFGIVPNAWIDHADRNLAFPYGVPAVLDADAGTLVLREAALL